MGGGGGERERLALQIEKAAEESQTKNWVATRQKVESMVVIFER